MAASEPSFLVRLSIAFSALIRAIRDPKYAAALARFDPSKPARRRRKPKPEPQIAPALTQAQPDSALLLLGLFQQQGRLVDFLQEDVTSFSDGDVGAAARVVHQGCRQVLDEYLSIEPVRAEAEGARVTLPRGFNAAEVRPTGNVVGEPPFTGRLIHRGWRAAELKLPQISVERDMRVLAAAEVEL